MKKIKITLEYDEKFHKLSEKDFESILYGRNAVNPKYLKIVDFDNGDNVVLKICENCKTAFHDKSEIESDLCLCEICYDYFIGE